MNRRLDHFIDGVRRIGVLRAGAVGDFVVMLPALQALRRTYPAAQIIVLGKPWLAEFLQARPGPVDAVFVLPPMRGIGASPEAVEDARAVRDCIAQLQAYSFDIVLQWHGGGRYSNPFVRQLDARVSAGFATPDALPLDRTLPYHAQQHETLRLLEGAALVGAAASGTGHLLLDFEPQLITTPADRREADMVVPLRDQPIAVLHPGAGDPRRRWPAEHFAAVGDALASRGAHVVINGTENEQDCVQAVASAMRAQAQPLHGELSLGGLLALLQRASLLVTNDSGPWHLARAVATPSVAVAWIGNLMTYGPLTWTDQAVASSWRMHCPVCNRHCMTDPCDHRNSWVDDVSVTQVQALVDALWRTPTHSPQQA